MTGPARRGPSTSRRAAGQRAYRGLAVLIFLAGLAVFLFPTLSDWHARRQYQREIAAWEAARPQEDYTPLWEAAEEYNRTLSEKESQLRLSDGEAERVSTLLNPMGNGMMGYVDIPKIDVHLPIYQGTEEPQLQAGAGWWIGTSLPTGGADTHCVLTAHNGLVKAKMFTDLDKLEVGDTFSLTILDRTLTYEVDQILVTEPEDLSHLTIVEGEDLVTLYTCTPYGVNTHRLLVRGRRIFPTPEAAEERRAWEQVLLYVSLAVAGCALGVLLILQLLAARHHGKREAPRGQIFSKRRKRT